MTYIVLQRGRQRAGAWGAGTRTKLARSQRAGAPFNENQQAKPPCPGGRCGEERGAVPAVGLPLTAPSRPRRLLGSSPAPGTQTRVCSAACAPGRALRLGSSSHGGGREGMHLGPGRGPRRAGGGGGMIGGFLGARLTAGVFPPPRSCPAEERAGMGSGRVQGGDGAVGRGSRGSRVGSAEGWPPRQPEAGLGEWSGAPRGARLTPFPCCSRCQAGG